MPCLPHRCTTGVLRVATFTVCCSLVVGPQWAFAESPQDSAAPATAEPSSDASASARQTELETNFAKLLTGATLEGSYTSTGPGRDPSKLSHDKYTLGEVKKIGGQRWLIEARIQYDEHDVTLPITVPVRWAGDTPVIVVDKLGLPEFGTVSARVMFFGGHYAGYWKHGRHGGHLFGIIVPREKQPAAGHASE